MLKSGRFRSPSGKSPSTSGVRLTQRRRTCFFAGDDKRDPGVCIYLDGLSARIHGNPERRAADRAIREELRSRNYEVLEIAGTDLDDRAKMAQHFFKLGRLLFGPDRARDIRDRADWHSEERR